MSRFTLRRNPNGAEDQALAALQQRLERLEVAIGETHAARQTLEDSQRRWEQQVKTGLESLRGELMAELEAMRGRSNWQRGVIKSELQATCTQLRRDAGDLTKHCEAYCNARCEALDGELQALSGRLEGEALGRVREALDVHETEIERLKGALSGDGGRLLRFIDEEKQRAACLRVEGTLAEWCVSDVAAWVRCLPRGQCLDSPPFDVEVPGVGNLGGIRLRFYPNGRPHVASQGVCSLFLTHPPDSPWFRYELTVGRSVRGPFDPLFGGVDDFCQLEPELSENKEEAGGAHFLLLSVRFLPHERGQLSLSSPRASSPSLWGPMASPSAVVAPKTGDLWLSSNRIEA